MRRTFRTLNDYEMQHNAEVGLFTRPSIFTLYPNVAKVRGLQSQGWSRSRSTANPWQRRIWSPPAFP